MEFEISRRALLNPLRLLTGIVERKQTLPILGNLLLTLNEDGRLAMTATDSELEIRCAAQVEDGCTPGETTLPALKLFDICRSLADDALIHIKVESTRATVKSGRSRFTLAHLPAEDFPSREEIEAKTQFSLPQETLKSLLGRTQFAMAQQDVRYYLNGMLLDISSRQLNVVATDGHRLALIEEPWEAEHEPVQVIIPRKAVTELARNLEENGEPVQVEVASNHIRFVLADFVMISKLIDGTFPDYHGVIPYRPEKNLTANCALLKQSLARAAILSSEKYKGVRLALASNQLCITAHNPEQEEAEETIDVVYAGEEFEIGFNVAYLLDALNAIESTEAMLYFTDSNSSCLIQPADNERIKYVIMPMRL